MNADRRPRTKAAFTLLEVILAVALTAVIMVLIASAVDMHLRQLTTRRSGVEEAQLARAILRRIADDLRAVVVSRSSDEDLLGSMDELMAGDEMGMEEEAMSFDSDVSAADELTDAGMLPEKLGIYGSAYELHIDVSRVPRYEEYELAMELGDYLSAGSLGDVKTVSYFLLGGPTGTYGSLYGSTYGGSSLGAGSAAYRGTAAYGTSSLGAGGIGGLGYGASGFGASGSNWQNGSTTENLTGLARRVIDRSTIRFAQENGAWQWLDQQAELFAPEVVALEFAYFDGTQWLMEWDTELNGGLPVAVEILLVVSSADDPQITATPLTGTGIQSMQVGTEHLYRLVVQMPTADPVTDQLMTGGTLDTGAGL
jgi:hypothetical protein